MKGPPSSFRKDETLVLPLSFLGSFNIDELLIKINPLHLCCGLFVIRNKSNYFLLAP